jgi:hypothetical protein
MFKNTVSGIDFKETISNSGSGSCYDAWFIEILMMGGGGVVLYCISKRFCAQMGKTPTFK